MTIVHILSTMTSPVSYCFYDYVNDLPVVRKRVTVAGGAGLPSLKSGFGEVGSDQEGKPLWTADGIVSRVSANDYDLLKDHPVFKKHLAKGYLKVVSSEVDGNHKKVKELASDMAQDGFRQLTPSTARLRVKTGSPLQEDDFRI